jgi:hypothetical protein
VSALLRTIGLLMLLVAGAAGVGCGPEVVKVDRTSGLEIEFAWSDAAEQRSAFYSVARDGEFASSGGLKAREREATFRAPLSDAEVARFIELVRATNFSTRADETGSDEPRSEVTVRDAGSKHRFVVLGPDAPVEALRAWLAGISMRQFRDVIEAQPQPGPRTR